MGEGEMEMKTCLTRMISIPMGVSVFPKDPMYAQQWWAEAAVGKKIVFWKEHEKGGHFASVEKPVQLIEDIRSFTKASKLSGKMIRGS
ncbi:epoxide hydrolase [Penicillium cinerascens]|uniref:Epoxide hydrolase n=1 Tax=Penicillium cinerascens TaxID=70096 RepID=A0A9W9JEH0_9EURO|nr:epoxide hydrolase [Penicillium cinerascens]KAJ5194777.1 epoxide hydrolase [Penicillium cinerascens]